MRRDYFTLDLRNSGDEHTEAPVLEIRFDGPRDQLRERLRARSDETIDGDETDIAYRLQGSVDVAEAAGVVGVTDRLTGEFIIELNAAASRILEFVEAARAYGKTTSAATRYRVEILIRGEQVTAFDKSTFLVYDGEGELLRQHSLIPSGVEL